MVKKSRTIVNVVCERPLRQRVSNSTDNVQVKDRYNKNALKLGRLRRTIEGAPIRLLSYLRTGKSLSEALIFASTNRQYDDMLFTELQVKYMKTSSLEHVVYINYSEFQK